MFSQFTAVLPLITESVLWCYIVYKSQDYYKGQGADPVEFSTELSSAAEGGGKMEQTKDMGVEFEGLDVRGTPDVSADVTSKAADMVSINT